MYTSLLHGTLVVQFSFKKPHTSNRSTAGQSPLPQAVAPFSATMVLNPFDIGPGLHLGPEVCKFTAEIADIAGQGILWALGILAWNCILRSMFWSWCTRYYSFRHGSCWVTRDVLDRLERTAHQSNFMPLFAAIWILSIALRQEELDFYHLRVVLDPAALSVFATIFSGILAPAYLFRHPFIAVMTLAVLVLLPIVGLRYDDELAKAIRDHSECFEPSLLTDCTPMGWIIYFNLLLSFLGTLLLNVFQHRRAKLESAKENLSINTILDNSDSNSKIPRGRGSSSPAPLIYLVIESAIMIIETIWIFTDYAALAPLLNPKESEMGFGQITAVAISSMLVLQDLLCLFEAQKRYEEFAGFT